MPKDLPVFKNNYGAQIRHPLLRQIEQDIKKTKATSWESEEAEILLATIFYNNAPDDFAHLIFDNSVQKPTTYEMDRMLKCNNFPYNYGNKTQYYMKWLVREITMPENVVFFDHMYLKELINLQHLYHLNNKYTMRYFKEPYGAESMQSVGYCVMNDTQSLCSEFADFARQPNNYSYVAIVHNQWRDQDIDIFQVQLPDIKNNQFYQKHFYIASPAANDQICAHGLTERMAKQALWQKLSNQSTR